MKPGPWEIRKMSKPQPYQYYVCRAVEDGTWSSPHFEQLWNEYENYHGFATEEDARAAIAKATRPAP